MKKLILIATVASVVLLAAACSSKTDDKQQKVEKWGKELAEAAYSNDLAEWRNIIGQARTYGASWSEEELEQFCVESLQPAIVNAAVELATTRFSQSDDKRQLAERWAKEFVEMENIDDFDDRSDKHFMLNVQVLGYMKSLGEEEGAKFLEEILEPAIDRARSKR